VPDQSSSSERAAHLVPSGGAFLGFAAGAGGAGGGDDVR